MARPIDGNELVDTLKQIVSDYTSHGMYPSAFPVEYAIEIVEKMPTLTPPNEWVSVEEMERLRQLHALYGGGLMSMTRAEAIERLEKLIALYEMASTENKMIDYSGIIDTLKFSLTALRPVSRERVEKVWRGEWNNINPAVLKPGVSWVCRCAKCGCPQDYKHNFCPNCGAAQTDEAVQMVMERLEALNEM